MKKAFVGLLVGFAVVAFTATSSMAGDATIPFWRAYPGSISSGTTLVAVTNLDASSQAITVTLYATGYGSGARTAATTWASTNLTIDAGYTWIVDTVSNLSTWTTGAAYSTALSYGSGKVSCATADQCVASAIAYQYSSGLSGFTMNLLGDDGASPF